MDEGFIIALCIFIIPALLFLYALIGSFMEDVVLHDVDAPKYAITALWPLFLIFALIGGVFAAIVWFVKTIAKTWHELCETGRDA
jgi:hypothetical protein